MKNNGAGTRMRMIRRMCVALLLGCLVTSRTWGQNHDHHAMSMPAATASAPAPAGGEVVLSTTVEEGKKQLVATVKLNGKPVEGATVWFGARRLFGDVTLGQDQTLDDGTAAIAFPSDLPGNANGELQMLARVISPPGVAGSRTEAAMAGGAVLAKDQAFPRALWAPQAPLGLIAVIGLLLTGAWGAYAFVVSQLVAIKKGANS